MESNKKHISDNRQKELEKKFQLKAERFFSFWIFVVDFQKITEHHIIVSAYRHLN